MDEIVCRLRDMRRAGRSVSEMFDEATNLLGNPHILDVIAAFRTAFCLSLSEVKPIVGLSGVEHKVITNHELLDQLVLPEIEKHRNEWDV